MCHRLSPGVDKFEYPCDLDFARHTNRCNTNGAARFWVQQRPILTWPILTYPSINMINKTCMITLSTRGAADDHDWQVSRWLNTEILYGKYKKSTGNTGRHGKVPGDAGTCVHWMPKLYIVIRRRLITCSLESVNAWQVQMSHVSRAGRVIDSWPIVLHGAPCVPGEAARAPQIHLYLLVSDPCFPNVVNCGQTHHKRFIEQSPITWSWADVRLISRMASGRPCSRACLEVMSWWHGDTRPSFGSRLNIIKV